MSPARCSSCHCFNRACPEGLPNHRHSTSVGQNCTMNSQGRHYRDQTDVSVPICDYEAKGSKCDFFTASHEHNVMPYPTDISLGPVSTDSVAQNSDISAILNLLQEQKAESEKQAIQLQQLAQKVNNMSTHSPGTPARHNGTPTRPDTGPPATTVPPSPVLK